MILNLVRLSRKVPIDVEYGSFPGDRMQTELLKDLPGI